MTRVNARVVESGGSAHLRGASPTINSTATVCSSKQLSFYQGGLAW